MQNKVETTGYVKGLFEGHVEDGALIPFPEQPAEERENCDLLLDSVRKFAETKIDSRKIDEDGFIPDSVKDGIAELGVMGLTIPEEYGGFGMSPTAYCRLMETITRYDGSVATHIGGHLSLGSKGLVLYGTPEQKQRFLPKMATGEWIGAYALTEAQSGSDAGAMKSRAVLDPASGNWTLNGTKIWCTNGGYAQVIQTFARTQVEVNGKLEDKVTAFVLTRDMPGFSSGKPEYKMGIKGSNTVELAFDNIAVPAGQVIGVPGKGFRVALEILDTGRLSLAAGCLGVIRECTTRALEHAEQRKQFGKSIVEFEMLREKFARMSLEAFALESMTYLTAGMLGRHEDMAVESAICKVFGTEAAWRAVNHAVQIAGGSGFMREYPYERMVRDARVNMIFEGTNEILRMFIALNGMQGPGEALKELVRHKTVGTLGEFAARKLRRVVSRDRIETAAPSLAHESDLVAEAAAELAKQVESVLIRHGKGILDREYLQSRIANAAIDLYAMSACIARTTSAIARKGEEGAKRELLMTKTFCAEARRRVRRELKAVGENHDESFEAIVDQVRAARDYPAGLY
jgi:acyl-CoA dehydrogenase family protein 9